MVSNIEDGGPGDGGSGAEEGQGAPLSRRLRLSIDQGWLPDMIARQDDHSFPTLIAGPAWGPALTHSTF